MFLRTGINQYFSVQQSDTRECGKCAYSNCKIKNSFLIMTIRDYDDVNSDEENNDSDAAHLFCRILA